MDRLSEPGATGQPSHWRVRAALPARLRLNTPEVRGVPARAAALAAALGQLPGVIQVAANPLTGRTLLLLEAPPPPLDDILAAVDRAAAAAATVRPGPVAPDILVDQDGRCCVARAASRPLAAADASQRPVGRDWARVVLGGLAVAALGVARL